MSRHRVDLQAIADRRERREVENLVRATQRTVERELSSAIAESVAVRLSRGEDVIGGPSQRAPQAPHRVVYVSQLERMHTGGKLGQEPDATRRKDAGERYGKLWASIWVRSLRSCCDVGERVQAVRDAMDLRTPERIADARAELDRCRHAIGDDRVLKVLEQVCGEDRSLHAMEAYDGEVVVMRKRLVVGLDALRGVWGL